METLEQLGDERGILKALRILGQLFAIQGRPVDNRATYERTLVMAKNCGEHSIVREVSYSIAYNAMGGGTHVNDAIRRCKELRQANRDDPCTRR